MSKPFDPKSTVFTNLALDKIMPTVSPNAWKIICFAIRKTAGWADLSTESLRKESDIISISQFRTGCGISSNDTVRDAIDECLKNGYLIRIKEGQAFRYRINQNYELPTVTESVTVLDTTVTESVNTNSKLANNKLINIKSNTPKDSQESTLPAKESLQMRDAEEIKKSTEDALFRSYASQQTGYAHYPERVRPVVEKMEKLWYFKPPQSMKGKGQYAFWVQSCDEIIDACAEFGVPLLDKLHDDWDLYMESHGGCAPYTISSPKSLVTAVRAKAALLRSKNPTPLWSTYSKQTSQTRLDV